MTKAVEAIGRPAPRKPMVKKWAVWPYAAALCWWAALCLFPVVSGFSQQPPVKSQPAKPQKEAAPSPAPAVAGEEEEQPLPGDWGPELLDGILSSPNEEAQYTLLRATFAAG